MTEWILTNCESVGNMHTVCQDHTECAVENEVYVGALADGVSSNLYANKGAEAVTRLACQELCKNFKRYYAGTLSSKDFVQVIQETMSQQFGTSYGLNQMKSTLLLCAVHKKEYILGHIGDGAILCFGKNSFVISPPQKNEVGGTATYTILDHNAADHFRFQMGSMEKLDGFLLTSDGLFGNVYYSGTDIPQLAYELFGSVYKHASPARKQDRDAQFKRYLAEHIQRGDPYADDCSLFMIARKKPTGYIDYDARNGFEADVTWPCKCGNRNRMDEIRCSRCRTMYMDLYPSFIVRISSKENFFSKLNKWLASSTDVTFHPQNTAQILDQAAFDATCQMLKRAVEQKPVRTHIGPENSTGPEQNDTGEQNGQLGKLPGKSQPVFPKKADTSNGKPRHTVAGFPKFGESVLKNGFDYLLHMVLPSPRTPKEEKEPDFVPEDIQKMFPVVIPYDQMVDAAIRLKRLPMEFAGDAKEAVANQKQQDIVQAMFDHDASFCVCQECVLRFYQVGQEIFAVCDNRTDKFYCAAIKNLSKLLNHSYALNSFLAPEKCFSKELRSCESLYLTATNQKAILPWGWTSAYFDSRGNARTLLKVFHRVLAKNGLSLEPVVSSIWFVAENGNAVDMVAYILMKHSLVRVKSIDAHSVEMAQVLPNDQSAMQLLHKYLMEKS